MVSVITNKDQIEKYQKIFDAQLEKIFTNEIYCEIGYPGGSWKDPVLFSKKLKMWTLSWANKNKKLNLFGIGTPIENKKVSITAQINFPVRGINRRIAGAFAIDENKKILVLHRGKIGGGKPGIGKNLLIENYNGEFVTANDGDRDSIFCLVGELYSPFLPKQIAVFIEEVARVRSLRNLDNLFKNDFSYTDEHTGIIVTEKNDPQTINRIHGIVVKALKSELSNNDFDVGNDKNRDLFIYKRKKITTLFEIKTSASTQNLYSVVGQLLIYSIPIRNKINLIAVLPVKLNKLVEKKLSSINIIPLYYKWNKGNIEFIGIEKLIRNDFCSGREKR